MRPWSADDLVGFAEAISSFKVGRWKKRGGRGSNSEAGEKNKRGTCARQEESEFKEVSD